MEYIAKYDVCISVVQNLSTKIKGIITVDSDGNPYIFINGNLSEEEQEKALQHELLHLKRNDLYSDKPAHEIEEQMP